MFVDICSNTDMPFQKEINIISFSNNSDYQMCQCNVQNGTFLVNQKDIRLKIKGKNMCSPAEVALTAMERTSLTCNENRANFGAIFETVFMQISSNASFSLFVNSKDPFLGMVWLSV